MNIRDIVVAKALFGNGGGGGGAGGGGSLPAGLYLRRVATKKFSTLGRPFVFNGAIHVLQKASDSTSDKMLYIFKLEGTEFKQAAAITAQYSQSPSEASIIVRNGKVHVLAYHYHFVWDGSTFVEKTKVLDTNLNNTSYACLHNGEIYWKLVNDHKTYVWNEASDTWTVKFDNLGSGVLGQYDAGAIFSYNGVMYCAKKVTSTTTIYQVDDETGGLEVLSTSARWDRDCAVTDKGIYRVNSGYLYLNEALLGRTMSTGLYSYLVEFNGGLFVDGGQTSYTNFQQIHIIEETEG